MGDIADTHIASAFAVRSIVDADHAVSHNAEPPTAVAVGQHLDSSPLQHPGEVLGAACPAPSSDHTGLAGKVGEAAWQVDGRDAGSKSEAATDCDYRDVIWEASA